MKKVLLAFGLLAMLLLYFTQVVWAVDGTRQNDVGITFESPIVESTKKKPPKKSNHELPSTKGKSGYLPHLGQMLTSFILLLTGVSCLVAFCGIVLFRKIYYI